MSEEQQNELEVNEPDIEEREPAPEQSADEVEATDTSDDGEDSAAERPKAKGVQKRIDELTANWRTTERDRDYWRELAMRNTQQQPQKQEQPAQPQEAPKPKEDDFQDYSTYLEALADWKADQKIQSHFSEYQRRQQEQEQQRTEAQRQQAFQQKAQEFAKEKPDFQAVVSNPSVPINEPMKDAILESDMGPQIAYHLGQHPDKAAQIAGMSAYGAAREIGRLEAQLSVPEKPKVSQAPDPVEPVGGGSERNAKDPEKMTTKEWMDWRNKQVFGQ